MISNEIKIGMVVTYQQNNLLFSSVTPYTGVITEVYKNNNGEIFGCKLDNRTDIISICNLTLPYHFK